MNYTSHKSLLKLIDTLLLNRNNRNNFNEIRTIYEIKSHRVVFTHVYLFFIYFETSTANTLQVLKKMFKAPLQLCEYNYVHNFCFYMFQ